MICKFCAGEVSSNFVYCPWCGVKLEKAEDEFSLKRIFASWKKEHYGNISKSMRQNYDAAWKRIKGYETWDIRSIKVKHYQDIIRKMAISGCSLSVMQKTQLLISQLCSYAIKNDIMDKNYGEYLELPKMDVQERERFTEEEMQKLWEHTDDETVRIMLILAYTGMRPNELFKLERNNVHLDDNYPHIISGSKTEAGKNRVIMISPLIMEYFMTFCESSDGKYIFVNSNGRPIDLRNWRERKYYPILEKLGIKRKVPYCLRHTFASEMVASDANLKAVSTLIGHKSVTTTLDFYAHSNKKELYEAILQLKK